VSGADPGASAPTRGRAPAGRALRLAGFILGLALVCAAGVAVASRGDALRAALSSARSAPALLLVLALALPLASLALTSSAQWLLIERHGRVPAPEMLALTASSWLLNFLPLWPGMFGRLAYLKAMRGIALRDSATTVLWANALSVIGTFGLLAVLTVLASFFGGDDPRLAVGAAAPAAILLALAVYARLVRPRPDPEVWRLIAVVGFRVLDLHVWAARYAVALAIVGAPVGWGAALALACIGAVATSIPLSPGGLGVREWAVGLTAPLLPAALTLQTGLGMHAGLSADLLNRAVEIFLAVPLGLAASAWLAKRVTKGAAASAT